MQYNKPFISTPIPYSQPFVIDVETQGDSYFFTLVQTSLPDFKLGSKRVPSIRPAHNIFLEDLGSEVLDIKTEGEDLQIVVRCSEVVTTDFDFDLTVSYSELPDVEMLRVDSNHGNVDHLITSANTVDFTSTDTYSFTFLAGSDTFTATIPTVDDTILTNKYRAAKIEITNSTNYLINSSLHNGYVLLKDASVMPTWWEGQIEVYVKSHELANFEPMYDENNSILTFNFGMDAATGITTLRSYPVDDLPIHSFRFQPVDTVLPVDPDGADLTGVEPLYTIIMQTGRRA